MRNALLILACFAAGLAGSNVPPLLSGNGCVEFPGTSPRATVCMSGGSLTVSAGGTNQNITLTPSGTGIVVAGSTEYGTWPVVGGFAWLQNSALAATSGNQALLQSNGGGTQVNAATGQTVTLAINGTTKATVSTTGLGVLGTPSFPLDVTGNVNTSGVYMKGGTAGVGTGGNVTVCTSGSCATSCTLQFSGGIRIGGTCPL